MGINDLVLKDLSKRPDHKEISRKGGKAKSRAKRNAVILNGLKNINTKAETKGEWLLKLCQDPEISAFHILELIKSINFEEINIKEKIMLIRTLIDWHKLKHPIITKIEHEETLNVKSVLNLLENFDESL